MRISIKESVINFHKDKYYFGYELMKYGSQKYNKSINKICLEHSKNLIKLMFKSSI